ncbi:MAG: ATP-binding protein, partial [Chloroflexota bacterium]
ARARPAPREPVGAPAPLVGREADVAAVTGAFDDAGTRLVTLTGPGGVGKTRLAQQAAAELVDRFADGVWFVPLAPLSAASEVAPAILEAMLPEDGLQLNGGDAEAALLQHLRERETLLALDNAEHLPAAAKLVAAIISGSPKVRIIATSRAPLRVRAEREYPVAPLGLPEIEPGGGWRPGEHPALDLFIERARAIQPAFAPDEAGIAAIAAICRALDGLPLAIELAAGRTRMLPPAAMLARLEKRLPLLAGGARDLPERHQTLRATIAWSADLLAPGEREVFEALSAFRTPAAFEAVEAVAGDDGSLDAFSALERLIEHNLVKQMENPDGLPRFAMLQTIREYAAESLAADPARAEAAGRRHAGWFRGLVESHHRDGFSPVERGEFDASYPDLLDALDWLAANGERSGAAIMAVHLRWFFYVRGHLERGIRALSALREEESLLKPVDAADGLSTLGLLLGLRGELDQSQATLERSLAIFREEGSADGALEVTENLGEVALFRGDLAAAAALREDVLAGWRTLGREEFVPGALNNLAEVAELMGDAARARGLFEEALALAAAQGDAFSAGIIGGNLAASIAAAAVGDAAVPAADVDRAWTLVCEGLRQGDSGISPARASVDLASLAALRAPAADADAAMLLGSAGAVAERAGAAVSGADAARRERLLAMLRGRLGADGLEQALAAGRARSGDAALRRAAAICRERQA